MTSEENNLSELKEASASAMSSRKRMRAYRRLLKVQRKEDKTDRANNAEDRLRGEQDWQSRGKVSKDRETRRRYLKRYYLWLKPFRGVLALLVCIGLFVSGLEMVIPILSGQLIDIVLGTSRWMERFPLLQQYPATTLVLAFGGIAVSTIVLGRVLNFWRNFKLSVVNAQVTHRLRDQLHERILRLPLNDLHDLKAGGVVSRLSGDVDGTIGLVHQALLSPIQSLLRLAVVAAYLFYLNWLVALLSLSVLSVMGAVYYILMRQVRPVYRSMGEDRQQIDARLTEAFGGIRVVRTFAREQRERLVYGVGHHTVIRKRIWIQLVQGFLLLFWEMLIPLTSLLIVALGCWLIATGHEHFTPGDIIQFQMLTFMVLNPVFMLVNSITETQRSLASMERVYELLERPEEKPDRPDALPAPSRIDAISIHGMWFAYNKEDEDPETIDDSDFVLRDVNLEVAGGSVVAFVGPSGAGKTTLTDLLARFHDPVKGSIQLNGVDLRDYRLAEYRSLLGVVQQEVFLFDGTIRENIAYGTRHASEEAIISAAQRANALEFIEKLEKGFDSIIGERGVKLSGGQRQRLSIARAILADPKMLILDEATSNLDTESEQLIQASLSELFKNRTTFVVAHRLSTIRNADLIVVIDEGQVQQQGTHAALMAAGAGTLYYDMVQRQQQSEHSDPL